MNENNEVIQKVLGKGPYNSLHVMRFIQSRLCLKCQLPLTRVGLIPNEGGIMLEGCSLASHIFSECEHCLYQNSLIHLCAQKITEDTQNEIHGVNSVEAWTPGN